MTRTSYELIEISYFVKTPLTIDIEEFKPAVFRAIDSTTFKQHHDYKVHNRPATCILADEYSEFIKAEFGSYTIQKEEMSNYRLRIKADAT